jgi:hypothetical protein
MRMEPEKQATLALFDGFPANSQQEPLAAQEQ